MSASRTRSRAAAPPGWKTIDVDLDDELVTRIEALPNADLGLEPGVSLEWKVSVLVAEGLRRQVIREHDEHVAQVRAAADASTKTARSTGAARKPARRAQRTRRA